EQLTLRERLRRACRRNGLRTQRRRSQATEPKDDTQRGGPAHHGKNSGGIGWAGSSSNQIAETIHQRLPSQNSCSALIPRPCTGPSRVRRSSYVLQTCVMLP